MLLSPFQTDRGGSTLLQFVTQNDLGKEFNDKYRRWARPFLRYLKRNLRRLRYCSYFGFTATNFRSSNKKRSRRGKTLVVNGKKVASPTESPTSTSKPSKCFKYGYEVPSSFAAVPRLDRDSGSRKW